MQYEVVDELSETDLSKLIHYTLSFQPLQLLLQGIVKRVRQSEVDNERQDDEISELRKQLEDLKNRDMEREAQLQKLLRERETATGLRAYGEKQAAEKGQAAYEPVDLQPLWAEVERLKKLMGDFQLHSRRRTIDELYEARKRHDSIVRSPDEGQRLGRLTATSPTGEPLDEGEAKVGDAILSRAREELHLGDTQPYGGELQQALLAEEEAQGMGRVTGEEVQPPGRREETRQPTPRESLQAVQQQQQQPQPQPQPQPQQLPYAEEKQPTQPPPPMEQPREGLQERQAQQFPEARQPTVGAAPSEPQAQSPQTTQQQQTRSDSGRYAVSRSGEFLSAAFSTESPLYPGGSERMSADTPMFDTSSAGSRLPSRGRVPQTGHFASIYDRLRQDGVDIEYLNRVVAEMLNEMRNLHADMDNMRSLTLPEKTGADKHISSPLEVKPDIDNTGLLRRVEKLEGDMERMKLRSVPSEIPSHKPDAPTPADDTERRKSMQDNLQRLNNRLDALDQAQDRMNARLGSLLNIPSTKGGDTGISPAQFAALRATVEVLERQLAELQEAGLRNYDNDLDALRAALDKLQRECDGLQKMCEMLDEKKADKSALPRVPISAPDTKKESQAAYEAENYGDAINDLQQLMDAIQNRMCKAEANIKDLDEVKADCTALDRLVEDLRHLRHLLELSASRGGDGDTAGLVAAQEEALRKLQEQLAEHATDFNSMRDGTTNELSALREYVEQIDHRKADATLVANKAERDYVENALERLMREVEQVLNATNAGLIDTLDKSLNVLRDMLEGKATKNDMAQLQRLVAEDHSGTGAPDALMGFKGFRCLGCNRAVESMRPRVLANRLQPFVNRLPQNLPSDGSSSNTARIQQGPGGGTQKSIASAPVGET